MKIGIPRCIHPLNIQEVPNAAPLPSVLVLMFQSWCCRSIHYRPISCLRLLMVPVSTDIQRHQHDLGMKPMSRRSHVAIRRRTFCYQNRIRKFTLNSLLMFRKVGFAPASTSNLTIDKWPQLAASIRASCPFSFLIVKSIFGWLRSSLTTSIWFAAKLYIDDGWFGELLLTWGVDQCSVVSST